LLFNGLINVAILFGLSLGSPFFTPEQLNESIDKFVDIDFARLGGFIYSN
jgi:hypothetical protein